jgi:hypothetical protein
MEVGAELKKSSILLSHPIGVNPISLGEAIVKILLPQLNDKNKSAQLNIESKIINCSDEIYDDTTIIYDLSDIKELKNTLLIFSSLSKLIYLSNLIFPEGLGRLRKYIRDGCYIIILTTYGVSNNDIKLLSKILPNTLLVYSDFAYMGTLPNNLYLDDIYYSVHECLMTKKQNEIYTFETLKEIASVPIGTAEVAHKKCSTYCNIILPNQALEMYREGISVHDIIKKYFVRTLGRTEYDEFGNQIYANATKIIDLLTTISLNSKERHVIMVDQEDIYGGEILSEILQIKGYRVISLLDMTLSISKQNHSDEMKFRSPNTDRSICEHKSDDMITSFNKSSMEPGIIITSTYFNKISPVNIQHLHLFDIYDYETIQDMIFSIFSYSAGTKILHVHNYVAMSNSETIGNNTYDTLSYTKMNKVMNPYMDEWEKLISKSKHMRFHDNSFLIV